MQIRNSKTENPVNGRWVKGRWVRQENDVSSRVNSEDFSTDLDKGLFTSGLSIPFRLEWGVYASLVLVALAMRLYDLGGRAVHHDESLHGYFAYQMFVGGGYDHNPLMHGMFLFHSIATSFFLFGDSAVSYTHLRAHET